MEAYSILAKYYDQLMKDFDYSAYLEFIKGYAKGEGVDLACGTGEMTIALTKLGAKVIGVDLSEEMLSKARDKARLAFKNIIFIESDLKDFKPPHKVDFVTCVCDGFNYVDAKTLKASIDKDASYLKSGGYFIFDISSKYKLENVLGNGTFCEDLDNITYIWSNKLEGNKVSMQISFFEHQKGDTYKRIDENQTQFIYDKNDIFEMLDKDFEYNVFDGTSFKELKDDSLRYLFIARRK